MNAPTNGHTRAEQRAEAYRAAQQPGLPPIWPPIKPPAVKVWGKVRQWALAALLGLLLGAGGMWTALDQYAPLAGAVAVRNGIVVSEVDGPRYFLVSGWAVPIPKADGQ